MLNTMFHKGVIPLLEKAINFTELRHRQIINNIVNVDTPFYKVKDLPEKDFIKFLEKAIEKRDARVVKVVEFEPSSEINLDKFGSLKVEPMTLKETNICRHDENSVSIDKEMVKLAKNTAFHNAYVEILSSKFKVIEDAIRERVG